MPSLIPRSLGTKATGVRCANFSLIGLLTKQSGELVRYLMVPHQDGKVDEFRAFFCNLVVGGIYVGCVAIPRSIPWLGGIRGRER